MRPLAFALGMSLVAAPALASPSRSENPDNGQSGQSATQRPEIDVAFVLDTTSSMGGLIEGAKQKIWSIASRIGRGQPAPELKVALVAYRDVGDAYVVKRFDFTKDLDAVYANLRALRAEGGGDRPEHVGRGIGEAVSKLSWSQDAKTMKTMFLVGDAPPADRHDDWNYRTWSKAAGRKGIVLNTIRCGSDPETEQTWREIAGYANGTYASIEENGGTVAVVTPYDRDLATLNGKIARTAVYGGSAAGRAESERKEEVVADLPAESAASRMSYVGSAHGVAAAAAPATGAKDLVASPKAVDEMSEEELPAQIKAMPKAKRHEKLEALANERAALDKNAAELVKKRDAWLATHADDAASKGSLDAKVMGAIAKQAKKSGIAY